MSKPTLSSSSGISSSEGFLEIAIPASFLAVSAGDSSKEIIPILSSVVVKTCFIIARRIVDLPEPVPDTNKVISPVRMPFNLPLIPANSGGYGTEGMSL